jgi:hypothetical protein
LESALLKASLLETSLLEAFLLEASLRKRFTSFIWLKPGLVLHFE